MSEAEQAVERGDHDRAIAILQAEADAGNADAQVLLALMYDNKQGLETASPIAVQILICLAASQDHPVALAALEDIPADERC